MARNEQAKATIYLDGKQAEAALEGLKNRAKALKDELKKAQEAGDLTKTKKLQSEIAGVEAATRSLRKETFDYEKVLKNMNGSSLKELKQALRTVEIQYNKMKQSDPGYQKIQQHVKILRGEVTRLTNDLRVQQGVFGRVADGFNKYFGMATAAIASLTGAAITIKGATEAYAKHDDVLSDVMKTTRLTKEEVKDLNREFTNIDTRTTRENLNAIAEEGGRIGIAKEDILEFVKAMDIANVALGDSFTGGTAEIASVLGKLKFLFEDTKNMEIEKSYLSIASAINELGANGVASEQNIAEFATRLGSLSAALKPSSADALALGAAFEESGIEAEIASRAYSIVLNRAATGTEAFARVMGKSKEEVEALINANPVDFFLEFSKAMNGMNATDTARTLDELKINADGANKVIGAAANSTNRFRELLLLSNDAFRQGSSVIQEFNTKNENAQARLDKARKVFSDTQIELGERLAPAYASVIHKSSLLLKVLGILVEFVFKYGRALTVAAVAIGTYTLAVNAQNIATKAYNLLTTAATAITKGFNTAVKSNPVGLLISLLTTAATAYFLFRNKTVEAKNAQTDFNKVVEEGNNLLQQSKTLDERAAIIKNLSREQLDTLKSDLETQVKTEEDFHATLLQNLKKRLTEDAELKRLNETRNQSGLTEIQKINLSAQYNARAKFLASELEAENKTNQQRLTGLKNHLANVTAELKKRPGQASETPTGDPFDDNSALTALEIANQKRILELQQQYAAEENMQKFLHARLLANELAYLQAKEALETDEGKKLALQTQIVLKQVEYNRATKEAIDSLRLKKRVVEQINPKLLEEGKIISRNAKIAAQAAADQEDLNKQLENQAQRYQDTITVISDGLYEMMSGSEDAFKTFAKNILIFALEQLKVQTQIAIAGVTIQGLATILDPTAMFRAAIKIGLIEAAFAALEGLVNNAFTGKGKRSGGFTDPFAGEDEITDFVHGKEWVASAPVVSNPATRRFIDVFEIAQRSGSIKQLTIPAIIGAVTGSSGKRSGGFTSSSSTPSALSPLHTAGGGSGIDQKTITDLTTAINLFLQHKPPVYIEEFEKKWDAYKDTKIKRNL